MKIVHIDDVPLNHRTSGGREGSWSSRRVVEGTPGSVGNFNLTIFYQDGSFFSPRHHHNFDQFRYQIEGDADFAQNGTLSAGVLGYFAEGAYYGSQSGPAHTVAVLQFGGVSRSGYMGSGAPKAMKELKRTGVFEKGIYHRNEGVPGKPQQDSYEALWEHYNQRPLVYPSPQYQASIFMETNEFPWMPVEGAEGVEQKLFIGKSDGNGRQKAGVRYSTRNHRSCGSRPRLRSEALSYVSALLDADQFRDNGSGKDRYLLRAHFRCSKAPFRLGTSR